MLETPLLFFNLFDQSYDILIVFSNPHSSEVEILNRSVINDNPMERHMTYI